MYILLIAALIQSIRTMTLGRSAHFADEGRDYFNIIKMTKEYSPLNERPLRQALQAFKLTGAYARLVQTNHITRTAPTPLSIAESKRDERLIKLVLEETGNLFCNENSDAKHYSVETAHQLALYECGMGLSISKNHFDTTSYYGAKLTEILEHNTPEAKALIEKLIKVIDDDKFIHSHPMFDDHLISTALRTDNVFLMDQIFQMHSFRGVLFEAKKNETMSLMQFVMQRQKSKLLQYFLRFVRSKYDVEFIQSKKSQFHFSEAFAKSVNKLEFAFAANDTSHIITLVNRSPKNFALRLALIHAHIDNQAESSAIEVLLNLIQITRKYPFHTKALQAVKLVLGQFGQITDGTPDELRLVKILEEKHPLLLANFPMTSQGFEHNELIDKFFYLKLNRYIDLKSHRTLSQSFIPRTTLDYHMMQDINLALSNEYQHYLNSNEGRHLTNLLALMRTIPNHKIYYLHHELAIIFYEMMRQSLDPIRQMEYYRNATWFDPSISTEFQNDRQFQAELDPTERAVLVTNPDLLLAKITYMREKGFKHLFSIHELECKLHLLTKLSVLLVENLQGPTQLKEQITAKLDYIVHIIEFLNKYNYYSEFTKQAIMIDAAAKLKVLREYKIVLTDKQSYTLDELDAVLSRHKPHPPILYWFNYYFFSRLLYTISFFLGCHVGLYCIQKFIAAYPQILFAGNSPIVQPSLPPLVKPITIKTPQAPQTATQAPLHPYLGQLRSVEFNHKQGDHHRVYVDLPMIIDAKLYPLLEGFTPNDEIVTQGMIRFALAGAKKLSPKINVDLIEKDGLMILSIDNRIAVFSKQYSQFMSVFQQELIDHSPKYSTACARKVLLDELLKAQHVNAQSIVTNRDLFSSERREDITRLVQSLNQLITTAKAHQARSCARATLKALEIFSGLQKTTRIAPQMPHGLTHRKFADLQRLSLQLMPKCHDYAYWIRSLEKAWNDVVEGVSQCKIMAKQFGDDFSFDWVQKPIKPNSVVEPIVQDEEDSESDEEIPEISSTNQDDDNDAIIAQNQQNPTKFDPRALTDEEITRIAAPVSWCTAVLPAKKSIATSSAVFLPERKVHAQDRVHIENASELCNLISEIARPLIAINSPARRRLVVYQLIDLFAQLNLECELLARRNYIRRAFQQDILSIRDLLRHFSAFYLQADFDERSNQLLQQYTHDLPLLFKQARSEDSAKQANIAIFAKHALSEHRELDEYLAALQEDLAFLKGQTSQHSLNTLVDQGHIHLYLGYLTQIGNIVHEIIQDESLRHPFYSIRGQGRLLSISQWMSELENTDLVVAPMPLRQIFYFCLQVRNIRGHELQDVSTHFVLGLIRRVMIDVDELQNYIGEFHHVFHALKQAPKL